MKRAVIAAGGTGGHFYPGLTAAKALRARGWQVLMLVRTDDPALPALEKEDIPALPVDLRGLPRRPGPELFAFAAKLIGSLGLVSRALRDFRPDLALGMGGYLSFPLAYAARRRGVPSAVHESNSILGLANVGAKKLGATVFWGLPSEDATANDTLTGTPIREGLWKRKDVLESRKKLGLDPKKKTVLVFGGSQGAKGLNDAMPKASRNIFPEAQILHLAGRDKRTEVQAAYEKNGIQCDVRPYCDDMASAYGAADLVICRSGASTLAELAAQRLPAILVPYPHAAADHQNENAKIFEAAGAALRLPESSLDEKLGSVLADLLKSGDGERKRHAMAESYAKLGLPPAERTTTDFVSRLERLTES